MIEISLLAFIISSINSINDKMETEFICKQINPAYSGWQLESAMVIAVIFIVIFVGLFGLTVKNMIIDLKKK